MAQLLHWAKVSAEHMVWKSWVLRSWWCSGKSRNRKLRRLRSWLMNATRCFCGSWTWISTFSDQEVTLFFEHQNSLSQMNCHDISSQFDSFALLPTAGTLSHSALTLHLDPIGPGTKSQQLSRSWSYSPGSLSAFRSTNGWDFARFTTIVLISICYCYLIDHF